MATIKWSTGETYQQSYRKKRLHQAQQQQAQQQQAQQQQEQEQVENIHGIGRNFVFKDSYKEEVLHRIGERDQMQQCCINPFVGDNFIKDLAVQEENLKPRNSHYSK